MPQALPSVPVPPLRKALKPGTPAFLTDSSDTSPSLGAVHVAGPKLGRQTIFLAIEQQQRVIAGRFEMPVLSAMLLLAVAGDQSKLFHRPRTRISAIPMD